MRCRRRGVARAAGLTFLVANVTNGSLRGPRASPACDRGGVVRPNHRTAAVPVRDYWPVALSLLVLGLIITVGLAVSPSHAGSAQGASPAVNGKIAFGTNRGASQSYEIFAMNPDGSDQTNLTNNSRDDCAPAWSPDGARIAFNGGDLCLEDIFVMNADGSGQAT